MPVYIPIDRASKTTKKGDILLARYGASVGKIFYAEDGAYNVAMAKVIPLFCNSLVYIPFLFHYYHSSIYQMLVKNNSRSAQAGFNREDLNTLLLPLPPLAEQKRIVKKIEELEPFIEEYGKTETELTELNTNFPEQIKKSILQYAIQGKLVEQDPNDEPASELLKKIKAEKAELVKQGKIKKDKQESRIFKGDDNRHYEQIGSEVRDITEEIPFKIPNSWEWVRLGNVCQINPRNTVDDGVDAAFIPMNLITDGFNNKHSYIVKKWKEIKQGFTHFANNDVGVAKITPCFENRKSVIFSELPNGIGSGTTELHIIRQYCNILPLYILTLCKSEYFISNGVKNFTGTAGQQRICSQFVKELLLPLPPINEQHRIIQKLSKLLKFTNQL